MKDWRKCKFGEIFSTPDKGDAAIVSELSRLGRSLNGSMESKIIPMMSPLKVLNKHDIITLEVSRDMI